MLFRAQECKKSGKENPGEKRSNDNIHPEP
jgi:hypothetical protein